MSQQEIQTSLQAAAACLQRGDGAGAAQNFERVLALDPANPYALNSLGVRALDKGEAATAEALFRRATAADPKEPALWLNVAKAQRLQQDDEGERASLSAALALDQRNFMALLRKAELHERLGEAGDAAQAWDGFVTLSGQAENLPHGILSAVSHGQAFLAQHGAKLGAAIDDAMNEVREGVSPHEIRRFDVARDVMLGRRRVYHNAPHGLHFPFLPADEFFDRDFFPWIAALEAQTSAIRKEFQALLSSGDAPFRPYVAQDAGTPQNLWTPLDHSLDWNALFLWEYGVRNEEICARCPATSAALSAVPQSDIPARAPTAFFSVLKPRTHIPPHTGVTNVRTIIHLPLIVPDGCRFRVGGETRTWREGEAFAFDDTIEHEAWNDSEELRAVLIFDVWNPWLSDAETRLLRQMFAASDASGLSPKRETGAGF